MNSATKKPIALIFGEDDNDQEVIRLLVSKLRPDGPKLEKRRKPLILMKSREAAKRRKNAQDIASQVARDSKRFDVRAVFAHQDCDECEPAHEELSRTIEEQLARVGIRGIAATPAWETEAWLFLWPDAAPKVVSSWSRPTCRNFQVGLIQNAKEAYRKALGARSKREYEERDAPKIVAKACEMGLLEQPVGRSDSFSRFQRQVLGLTF